MASRVLRSNLNPGWTFHEGELDRPDVRELLESHFAAMRSQSPRDSCHVLPPDDLGDPAISFWSLREAGLLLGVGALKALSAVEGEVKSMRTAPQALGRGVGTAILRHIVAEARRRAYRRLSLETGSTEPFAAALRLYEREGFVPCGPFGGYAPTPFTRFFALEL
ncbi:MAG TPA: GNAT family N-acetyltransferase [Sphingomicrobium sp.]|nr:GNAT family N-acetyltransferase [Sphingomicrobium sp.]